MATRRSVPNLRRLPAALRRRPRRLHAGPRRRPAPARRDRSRRRPPCDPRRAAVLLSAARVRGGRTFERVTGVSLPGDETLRFRIRTGRNRGGGDYRPSPARPVLRRCNALLTALVLHDIGVRQNFIRHRQVRARRSDRGATPSSAAGGRLSIHRTGRRRNHSNSKRKDCAETRRRLDV